MSKQHCNKPAEQGEDRSADPKPFTALERANIDYKLAGTDIANSHMLANYDNLPITAGKRPVCTWSLDTVEGRAKLHQCTQGGSFVLWDRIVTEPFQFEVTHLAASFSEWEKDEKTGELVSGPMIYLLGPTGIWHSSSEMVYRSLQELALLEGLPPWEPAVILQAERVPTRNKNVRIALTMIGRGKISNGVQT